MKSSETHNQVPYYPNELANMSCDLEYCYNIQQLDGNTSLSSSLASNDNGDTSKHFARTQKGYTNKNALTANHLPVISVCNLRSFFPKVCNFKNDFLEREIDFGLLCEVWQMKENKKHSLEIEKMLELDGLKYFSTMRPSGKRGGGAAIIANLEKFTINQLNTSNPNNLAICAPLEKPKSDHAVIKKIILCSFYCL